MNFRYEGGIQRSCGINQKFTQAEGNKRQQRKEEKRRRKKKKDLFIAKQNGGPYLKIQSIGSGQNRGSQSVTLTTGGP